MESSILNAIGIDPGIIIIIVLVAILFLFMYMIKVSMSMSRFMKKYKIFMLPGLCRAIFYAANIRS